MTMLRPFSRLAYQFCIRRKLAALGSCNTRLLQYHNCREVTAVQLRPQQEQQHDRRSSSAFLFSAYSALLALTTTTTVVSYSQAEQQLQAEEDEDTDEGPTTLLNWSGTHAVQVQKLYTPDSIAQVENIVRHCYRNGLAIRPAGSNLSPNALSFHEDAMLSMENLDAIIAVDPGAPSTSTGEDRRPPTVTVQAGARVRQVVDALRPYGLTLPNLASIAEQQMGGFVAVGAHGTGAAIAPVDEYVQRLKIVTPSTWGTITLDATDGQEFHLAKVGLGCVGVVTEITMECIPAHHLQETTFVLTRDEAVAQCDALLQTHKHMRFMWIPYTDTVVCVTNDPVVINTHLPVEGGTGGTTTTTTSNNKQSEPVFTKDERFAPLTDLLLELNSFDYPTRDAIATMGFGELRDALLAIDPLQLDHVKRCNAAEAEFWKRSQGSVIRPSDELLQFDCGGQQWVWEVCFATGNVDKSDGRDMRFMQRLLEGIEEQNIPAHSPIEQRWSAASSSLMSPAAGEAGSLHCWVGIINYIPSEQHRSAVTKLFKETYCPWLRNVCREFNAASHWAKLERPDTVNDLVDLQMHLQERFPVRSFNALRAKYDPKNLLANSLIDMTLGKPPAAK
jgi:L-galactono-1,4-lactone dehydrogenase